MKLELDRFAHIDSPLQRWDARWKIAACAVFVIFTLSLRHPGAATAAFVLAAGLTVLGRLPVAAVWQRLKPVLTVVIAIAAVLALTAPGREIRLAGLPLSRDGLNTAALVATKALAVVLTLVALISSSPAQRTWAAMRELHLPAGLVQIFHLAYRYVFVIQSESRAVQTAMRARGFRTSFTRRSLAVLGNAVGMLLIRSTERAESVYLAMQARGYDGNFPLVDGWHSRRIDALKFLALAGAGLLLKGVDLTWAGS